MTIPNVKLEVRQGDDSVSTGIGDDVMFTQDPQDDTGSWIPKIISVVGNAHGHHTPSYKPTRDVTEGNDANSDDSNFILNNLQVRM